MRIPTQRLLGLLALPQPGETPMPSMAVPLPLRPLRLQLLHLRLFRHLPLRQRRSLAHRPRRNYHGLKSHGMLMCCYRVRHFSDVSAGNHKRSQHRPPLPHPSPHPCLSLLHHLRLHISPNLHPLQRSSSPPLPLLVGKNLRQSRLRHGMTNRVHHSRQSRSQRLLRQKSRSLQSLPRKPQKSLCKSMRLLQDRLASCSNPRPSRRRHSQLSPLRPPSQQDPRLSRIVRTPSSRPTNPLYSLPALVQVLRRSACSSAA